MMEMRMATLKYVEVNSDEHYDILVEVGFEKSLAPEDTLNVLKILKVSLTDSLVLKRATQYLLDEKFVYSYVLKK